ncbi:MAG TPA: CbtB-domain containing protein [Solirubrobacteraceae bacterium]|jgi:Probable cobalt transporter subunit (CbtB)|nr:CbtB-domain containing protein [Solirubrobacteraceae bacterium]
MNQAAVLQPIPLRDLLPWLALAAVLMLVLWLVVLDQGQVSRAGNLLHELMHDGRHLIGAPCH